MFDPHPMPIATVIRRHEPLVGSSSGRGAALAADPDVLLMDESPWR
jgi:hypothetical protein